jgi:glycosyltransferase involved in cell wall biosynthesis
MKIGIDIRPLSFFDNKAGIYQYTYNLVSNLLSIDSHNDYTLLSIYYHGRGFRGNRKIESKFVRRFPGRLTNLILQKCSLPIELMMGKLDIFHGPCFFIPNHFRCKSIVTIHDLMTFRYPEFLRKTERVELTKMIYVSVKRADAVVTVTNFTKWEIVELLNVPEERIRVIYNGIAPACRPIKEKEKIEHVKAKYGVKGPYLLFVGNIEPKKNIEKLIHACTELRNSSIYKYPLLVVGKKTPYFKTVWGVVQQLHAENYTIFTDVVDDDDLPYLYSGAELFIFPSLYEGFGIPVIEAMASGIPVVASNRTSIPEIAGDAAILVNPLNVGEMAGVMYNVLSTPLLRRQLVEKGIERAKDFSWEKTAKETLRLYQELV